MKVPKRAQQKLATAPAATHNVHSTSRGLAQAACVGMEWRVGGWATPCSQPTYGNTRLFESFWGVLSRSLGAPQTDMSRRLAQVARGGVDFTV